MKTMLQFELKRALLNRTFVLALLFGTVLALLHAWQEAFPYAAGIRLLPDQYPPSVYNTCMGLTFSVWQYIFYMVFPILAALPYANSYLRDVKSGYIKNLYLKVKRRQYLVSKFLAVFLSGGLAVCIPIGLNFLFVSLCVPAVVPHAATGFFAVFSQAAGSELFYTQPHLYILLFAVLLFLTAGVLACTALAFSFFIQYSYVVLLAPFLFFLSVSYGSALLSANSSLNISHWIVPSQAYGPLNLPVVMTELAVIFFVSMGIYFYRGMKDDAF